MRQVVRSRIFDSFRRHVGRRARGLARLTVWLTLDDVLSALVSLGPVERGVFVHSSLSVCGHIAGGAHTVVDALCAWTDGALLALPTHTYCYPAQSQPAPVFDASTTPSLVGQISDRFWQLPSVVRSRHPTHSLAARGPGDSAMVAAHESCATPCGTGTPYERLIASDCSVLMFGATLNTYTFFHTAEDAAGVKYLYDPEPCELRFLNGEGHLRVMSSSRHNMLVARRFAQMADWLEDRSLLVRRPFGRAELLFLPHSADVHEAVVAELRRNPSLLRADGR